MTETPRKCRTQKKTVSLLLNPSASISFWLSPPKSHQPHRPASAAAAFPAIGSAHAALWRVARFGTPATPAPVCHGFFLKIPGATVSQRVPESPGWHVVDLKRVNKKSQPWIWRFLFEGFALMSLMSCDFPMSACRTA